MRKKIFSTIWALCILLLLLPTASFSVEEVSEHTHDQLTFVNLSDGVNDLLSSGNYYLTEDISINNTITIPNGNVVNLCLNGYSINMTGIGRVFNVSGTLNLYDCSPNQTGSISGGNGVDYGGGVNVSESGILSIYGGSIKNNSAQSGGGVYTKGTFTMNGGSISENTAKANSGTTTWGNNGGGVYIAAKGTFNMFNGSINGNLANWGGGSYVQGDGTFILSNGNISKNTAIWVGGGAYIEGMFTMNAGSINNNITTDFGGGGVGIHPIGNFIMSGGDISNNIGEQYAGGVYVEGPFTMTGNASISNNSVNSVNGNGGGLYLVNNGTLQINGSPVINNNMVDSTTSNVHLCFGRAITVIGELSLPINADSPQIGVTIKKNRTNTESTITTGYSTYNTSKPETYFFSDNNNYKVTSSATEAYLSKAYTVTYNSTEGTGTMTDDNSPYNYGDTVTLMDNRFTAPVGQTFLSWHMLYDSTYSGPSVDDNNNFTINNNVTVYAIWTPINYKVKFNANPPTGLTSTGSIDDQSFTYGRQASLHSNTFSVDGYTFKGWSTKPSGEIEYGNQESVVNLTENEGETINLYAVWQQTEISSISIKTPPSKITYEYGDNFDASGLEITVHYDNGESRDIAYNQDSDFSFDPIAFNDLGIKTVDIAYGGKLTTQYVTVTKKILIKPTISGKYTYTGSEQTVTLNNYDAETLTISNNKVTNAGQQNVSISLKDKTNYCWNDGSTDDFNLNWDIAKADIIVDASGYNGVFDGNVHTVTVTPTVAEGNIPIVTYFSDSEYTNTIENSFKKVSDSKSVYFRITAGDNYKDYTGFVEMSILATSQPSTENTRSRHTNDDDSSAIIIVNGETQAAGKAETTKEDGKTKITVTLDDEKLNAALEEEGPGVEVVIPVTKDSNIVKGSLDGQMVKYMEKKDATIEIRANYASYTLPISEIDIDHVSEQFGENIDLSDIDVEIEISEPTDQTISVVKNAANEGAFTIMAPAIDFTITCQYDGQSISVESFTSYVNRRIALPEDIDPAKITTAIIVNPDGTLRHVPTKIIEIDGNYYAEINSLTNSTYTLVYNPVEFNDLNDHWAKDSINNMGSRMIVSGVGNNNYDPDGNITRAEVATIVIKALGLEEGVGEQSFSDISESDWFCEAVKTAASYGLISGYNDGTFKPNDKITREQVMAVIAHAIKITGLETELTDEEISELLSEYEDAKIISDYAKESIATCVKTGIVSGKTETTLAPRINISRAEVAVIVERLLQKSNLI